MKENALNILPNLPARANSIDLKELLDQLNKDLSRAGMETISLNEPEIIELDGLLAELNQRLEHSNSVLSFIYLVDLPEIVKHNWESQQLDIPDLSKLILRREWQKIMIRAEMKKREG